MGLHNINRGEKEGGILIATMDKDDGGGLAALDIPLTKLSASRHWLWIRRRVLWEEGLIWLCFFSLHAKAISEANLHDMIMMG